jgi:hypothetical protein
VYKRQDENIRIAGILGFPAFKDCLLTLEYPRSRIVLERGSLRPPNGKDILPLHPTSLQKQTPHVEVRLGDQPVTALLDSGASPALAMSIPVAKNLGWNPQKEREFETQVMGVGGISRAWISPLNQPLHLGAHTLSNLKRTVLENTSGLQEVIIGGEALQNFTLTFDQKNQRVRIHELPHK